MTHLHGGILIDPRAWIQVATITDENLVLEYFKPGTMSDPGGEHQLGNMRDVLRAWFWYRTMRKRCNPWDLSNEVVESWMIEAEYFADLNRPIGGYYRLTSHPQHVAVTTLIKACHRVVIGRTQDRPSILTIQEIDEIHRQNCEQLLDKWSTTPPYVAQARRQRKTTGPAAKRQKAGDPVRVRKNDIKKAIISSGEDVCVTFNLGERCAKPEALNATVRSCVMKKGQHDRILAHACVFMVNGKRCGATDHNWLNQHP